MKIFIFVTIVFLTFSVGALTTDELAYRYSNNPQALCKALNKTEMLTITNCRTVTEKIYLILKRGGLSDIMLIGVWDNYKGHMFVQYRDRWGDLRLISVLPTNPQEDLKIVDLLTIRNDVDRTFRQYFPKAKYYREYRDNSFMYWKTRSL